MCDTTDSPVRRVPEIELTSKIRDSVEKALECDCVSGDLRSKCQQILQQKQTDSTQVVPIKFVRDVYKALNKQGHKVYLHEMIHGADLIPQTLQPRPRNPELEERIRKLKIEEENREYRRMTRNVDFQRNKSNFTFNEEVKTMNRQVLGILNFLVTVAAGFAFGYKGCELVIGKVFAMQMCSGLVLATTVFFADLYFLLHHTDL